MVFLNTELSGKYAYVKNNVVFDINSVHSDDSCCVAIDENNSDVITVTYLKNDDTSETVNYYLDTLIKDGDTMVENKFKPNDDHRKSYKGDAFETYKDLHRDDALRTLLAAVSNGKSFDDALKLIPLYLRYPVNTEFVHNTYKKITSCTISAITSDDSDYVAYMVKLAKDRGVECTNSILKYVEKSITSDNITIPGYDDQGDDNETQIHKE